ncbi:capsid and scaffold protein [Escherichia phage vB_EcoS_PHB17]|uniref:Capsid and scaffold protein n=1 Tax=Escherichia phage vB_EcoS_PHB17 TaxID=2591407 RepID=A0A514DKQ6_9CAUD|nr:head maturation protease [Escherichia phage vB_EcoS_PHB17]QDH94235.1 capsid and scaffold protein [Escherichia phage vB_EcoS_PHB17]
MKKVQRFDSVQVKAKIDEHGFLVDRPIVARIGLQVYKTPFGERREFRPASEVFKADSLETFSGKPITIGHVTVTPENAKEVVVGACAGAGVQNGIGVEVPLSIYDKRAIQSAKKKQTAELSVGYTSVDIDKPGWGNNATGEYFFDEDMPEGWKADSADWVRFDAVQTNISVNHIALVFKGRAGIAKLNLDSEQEFPYDNCEQSKKEDTVMTVKIKLDGAVEFDVPKEVATFIDTVKADAEAAKAKADGLEAERDALQTKVDGIPAEIEKAVKQAKADAEAHAELVKVAEEVGVKTDGLDAKAIKVAYVKEVTGADISAKADAYIDVAFDLAKDSDKMAAQRIATKGDAAKEKQDGETALNPNARLAKLNK